MLPPLSVPYWEPRSPPTAVESLAILCPGVVMAILSQRHASRFVAKRKLAGLPSVDDVQLRRHDAGNLIGLSLLLGLNVATLFGHAGRLFTRSMMTYFALDIVWVWTVPQCVPSPGIVLPHHFMTLALMAHPLRFPAHNILAALVTTVEAQTWIMVARRYFEAELESFPPLDNLASLAYWALTLTTRLMVHPFVLVDAVRRIYRTPAECVLVGGNLVLLCIFNVAFFTKEIKRLRSGYKRDRRV
mmetsp:Transcript_42952/g.98628  ORF Transcript_42952/g.98628 Transcript_42952/m.98628 type:complete len:244 (-) Transcript_42952:54-785(-)